MDDRLCPFSAPLVKGDFGCCNATEIVRRGGAEIACKSADAHEQCIALHAAIKHSALQAMNLADDLLTLPHSALVKIQYGGLLGLKNLLGNVVQSDTVDDIAETIAAVMNEFITVENIPLASVNKTILDFKAQRRRNKG